MKRFFDSPKSLFTLLMGASVIAIAAGLYLGVVLGIFAGLPLAVPAAIGLVLWGAAWGEFFRLCRRLRGGESAFTPASGQALRIIGRCMAGLAAMTIAGALLDGVRTPNALFFVQIVLLPGVFLGAGLAARILRGLLEHAMMLEKEQEGVI